MNNTTNYRIFVEKLPRFRVEAESLRRELNTNLNLSLGEVRLLCVYDLFGFSEELLEKSRYTVFGEVVDRLGDRHVRPRGAQVYRRGVSARAVRPSAPLRPSTACG